MSWEDRLDKEIRFHLEQAVEDYIAAGMSPEEARTRARGEFGSVALAKEEIRDTRPRRWLSDLGRDVRLALRGFRRTPGFAITAITVLALGIGANTAVFTLMQRVLLASLPVQNPDELVEIDCANPLQPDTVGCGTSFAGFEMYRERGDVFSGVFAYSDQPTVNVNYNGDAEIAAGMLVSGDTFNVLGVSPAAGRLLNPADDDPGALPVAVLSYGYWQRRFGGEPSIIGKSLRVNEHAFTVVGITPPAFRGVTFDITPDITLPLRPATELLRGKGYLQNRANWWLQMIGRKRPGVTLEQMQTALDPVYRRTLDDMAAAMPADLARRLGRTLYEFRIRLVPAARGAASVFRRDLNRPLRMLMGAVALVLLIACANLAGLMLARATARRREFGVRLAIGAGRARIVRQVLAESIVLAAFGAVAGLLVASWGGELLLRMFGGESALRVVDAGLDPAAFGFSLAVAAGTALLIGVLPAWRLSATDPLSALREARAERATTRLARLLIPAQVILTVILLLGASLLLETFSNLRRVDLGFRAGELLTFRVSPGLAGYDEPRSRTYFQELLHRLEGLPGVSSATISSNVLGNVHWSTFAEVPGFEASDPVQHGIWRYRTGRRLAETAGISLLRGRDLTDADEASAEPGTLVNESFARHFFGTVDCLGRTYRFGGEKGVYKVVGVVADGRDRGPKQAVVRTVYTPISQELAWNEGVVVMVRSRGLGTPLAAAAGRILKDLDSSVPVQQMQSAAALVESQLAQEKLLAVLSVCFGSVALLLVGTGLYGLIASTVAVRTREIGIRTSLGARPSSVAWLVTRESVWLVLAGGVLGLAAGAFLTRYIQAQLFGVTTSDPGVYLASAAAFDRHGGAGRIPARAASNSSGSGDGLARRLRIGRCPVLGIAPAERD